jgi:hypothetical protein
MTMTRNYYTLRPVSTEVILLVEEDFEEIRDYFCALGPNVTVTLNSGVWHFHMEVDMTIDVDYNTGDSVIHDIFANPWTPYREALNQATTTSTPLYTLDES